MSPRRRSKRKTVLDPDPATPAQLPAPPQVSVPASSTHYPTRWLTLDGFSSRSFPSFQPLEAAAAEHHQADGNPESPNSKKKRLSGGAKKKIARLKAAGLTGSAGDEGQASEALDEETLVSEALSLPLS